ncbi:MAG: undecaprenyl-diphosphatase UppP [Nitrospinota bacterium]
MEAQITWLQAAVLGIVEGFTEFLPISSTAHLILTANLLGIPQSEFTKTFEISIQSGAILAVVVLYRKRFLHWESLKKIIVAFIPTGILGLAFYRVIKTILFESMPVVLSSLAIGGLFLVIFEYVFKERDEAPTIGEISYGKAVGIGIAQSVAMIPGISRAGATIVGGMLLGIRRELIVEFSFLLAVPTMFAATGLELLKNLHAFSKAEFHLLAIGFAISFVMAILGIKFFLGYIQRHTLSAFGIYRILLVAVVLLILR